MNFGKVKRSFGLLAVLIILAKLAIVAAIVYCVFWLLANPSTIGEFFGRIVSGFKSQL